MLQIGSLVDNKYKILSEVGHGGMSVVYLAINERANKTWAVKEVRKDGIVDFESVRQGLIVETDMLKKLKHPNLPSIIDVIDTDDSFLIVMDYIEGSSLQKLLKSKGAQSEEKVIKWGKQICDVLGYLHRQNPPIIYRDMKPANVMLKPDGNVTLIDFGTAREFKNRTMVEDTTCLGTRGYAAPEQFGGRGQTDARTDIYNLGATMYHLLTGHSPAEPPYEIKPLSYWIPQYAGSGLEKLILKCTQFDPENRYQDCAELMYALEHYRDEDDLMQKERKKQWRRFLIAGLVGIIGLAGALGFRTAWNSKVQDSYDTQLQVAKTQETIEQSIPYINNALDIDAGKADAYTVLLDVVDKDRKKQGELTAETAKLLNQCLNNTPTGSSRNIDILQERDGDTYANTMYRIGLWYFFMKGNTNDDRASASSKYLVNIADSEENPYLNYLDDSEQQMAVLLYRIGNYIGALNDKGNKYEQNMEDNGTYINLFEDLKQIVSGDLNSKVGRYSYSIKIYEQVAYWLNIEHVNFAANGISETNMNDMLKTIENGLNDLNIPQDNDDYEDYITALNTVNEARTIISSYFSNRQKGGGN